MSVQFKHFVMQPFFDVLKLMNEYKVPVSDKENRMTEEEVFYFTRWKEVHKKEFDSFVARQNELIKENDEDCQAKYESSVNDMIKKLPKLSQEEVDKFILDNTVYNSKYEELRNCASELNPLDYAKVKKIVLSLSGNELEIIKPVLTNLPVAV